jgi:hypothetical protein
LPYSVLNRPYPFPMVGAPVPIVSAPVPVGRSSSSSRE